MERIPDGIALTSTETASLLNVHPSTVKRWCNDGELASELTPGGHRRISIDAAMELARERDIRTILTPFHPYGPHVWTALRAIVDGGSYHELIQLGLQWARRGDFERVEQLCLALGRSESIPFADFCDHAVRGLLAEVGHEWERGRLRVGDEHMVTQAVTGALLVLRRGWIDAREAPGDSDAPARDRPVAVVGTFEGNQHALGALCVRMVLERAGWRVFYTGADVPAEDFGTIQKSRGASLVCVSLPAAGSLGDVTRTLSILRQQYDRSRPCAIAFGGVTRLGLEGSVDEAPFRSVAFLPDCAALEEAVADGLGAVDPASARTETGTS